MKVKNVKICEAYRAISALLEHELPVKVGIEFYKMKCQLKDNFEYVCEEESKAIEKYGAEIKAEGRISFENPEDATAYTSRINEVLLAEVDVDIEPIDVSALGNDIKINFKALDGFITF